MTEIVEPHHSPTARDVGSRLERMGRLRSSGSNSSKRLLLRPLGEAPIDDLLRFGGDFFFGSEGSHPDPFFDNRVGYREIGVELLAVNGIEPLGYRAVDLQDFFH